MEKRSMSVLEGWSVCVCVILQSSFHRDFVEGSYLIEPHYSGVCGGMTVATSAHTAALTQPPYSPYMPLYKVLKRA